jgi:hypothetical protein
LQGDGSRADTRGIDWEAGMKIDRKFVEEIFWGTLSVLGVLAAMGVLAVAMRLGVGKW